MMWDTSGSSNKYLHPDWRQRRGMIIQEHHGEEAVSGSRRYVNKRPALSASCGFAPYSLVKVTHCGLCSCLNRTGSWNAT